MSGTDILSYADIFGYGQMGTGSLSHTLTVHGQIAGHFRAGASAKRVRDLLVSQGVRTAQAEFSINEVIVGTPAHVPLTAAQRLILQHNLTDRGIQLVTYLMMGVYHRPIGEITAAMVEWGYAALRVGPLVGDVDAQLDRWKRYTFADAPLGQGDVVALTVVTDVRPTVFPYGVLVGRTGGQSTWMVSVTPGWNQFNAVETRLVPDDDHRQVITRLFRNPSTAHYRVREADVAAGVQLHGFGDAVLQHPLGPFPTFDAWLATNHTELVRRFGEPGAQWDRPYWQGLARALYTSSQGAGRRVLQRHDIHVHGASDPAGASDGHGTPHGTLPAAHVPGYGEPGFVYTHITQAALTAHITRQLSTGTYNEVQVHHNMRANNYDPAMIAIGFTEYHAAQRAARDRAARAARPPAYGEQGWVWAVIEQATLDRYTLAEMSPPSSRTAAQIRATNHTTNYDPAQVDLSITRATNTLATARQAAIDRAHVPSYGEAGFVYTVTDQAALNATARAGLAAGTSEAELRNRLQGRGISQAQIDLAFAAPTPATPVTEAVEPDAAATATATPAATPASTATATAAPCPPGRRRLVQEGRPTTCQLPGVGQGVFTRQPRSAEVVSGARAATPTDNSFLLLAGAAVVAVLVAKNM